MNDVVMPIAIDKRSSVPIRRQIAQQVVFQIATGMLKPGDHLPSVREIALRQGIHPNTVSQAYQELVARHWISRHRGRRMVVRSFEVSPVTREEDLDDLIDATIRKAREKGYSLQRLGERVRECLRAEPPDHILVVAFEAAMARLIRAELSARMPVPVEACPLDQLSADRGPALGALVVCLPGVVWDLAQLLPRGRALVPIEPSHADAQLRVLLALDQPSVIIVTSISRYFLEIAEGLIAPFVGGRHAVEAHHLEEGESRDLRGADLVFCDSVTAELVRAPRVVPYRMVSPENVRKIAGMVRPG